MIRHFSYFIKFFQEATNSAALIDIDNLEYSEFNEIAIYANKMSLKQTKADTEIKRALNQKELLLRETDPSEDQVRDALSGILCRCTGYKKMVDLASTTPEKFQQLMQGELSQPLPGTSAPGDKTINNPALPQSKAEYDALDPGDYYMKNGKVKRKK